MRSMTIRSELKRIVTVDDAIRRSADHNRSLDKNERSHFQKKIPKWSKTSPKTTYDVPNDYELPSMKMVGRVDDSLTIANNFRSQVAGKGIDSQQQPFAILAFSIPKGRPSSKFERETCKVLEGNLCGVSTCGRPFSVNFHSVNSRQRRFVFLQNSPRIAFSRRPPNGKLLFCE